MGTTQPIRDRSSIEALKQYFLEKGEIRNYALVVIGLNLPLRISDLLSIKWTDIYDFQHNRYYSHLKVLEKKTKKHNYLALNTNVIGAFERLRQYEKHEKEQYIFRSNRCSERPLSRVAAYLIIHNAAENIGLQDIGCHSLRKTFGYHAWKKGVHLALIMSIYNHSSIAITKRYLGIEQEDKDNVFLDMNL